MKSTTLLAALAATLLPLLAAAPAVAATKCDTRDGVRICVDPASGTYEVMNLRQPRLFMHGRCDGTVSWGDLPFPAVNQMHQAICGEGSYLELQ